MANVDAPFEQKIFDLSQRQGVADIHHHREADYLRRTVEITERVVHRLRLRDLTSPLKAICSDNALSVNGNLIAELNDTNLTNGSVGLSVNALDGEFSEVAFDNFRIAVP